MTIECKGEFAGLGLSYKDAREIVTSPHYQPVRQEGAPKHPVDASYVGPDSGWGADYGKCMFYERQLADYIAYHFACVPAPGERAHYIAMEYRKQQESK